MHIVGYIFQNEGFTFVKSGGVAINEFMVNTGKRPITVYAERGSYGDHVIMLQGSAARWWRWGWVPEGTLTNCQSLGTRGVRSFTAAIKGKGYNVVYARYTLDRYSRFGKLIGTIPRGSMIAFPGEGYSGGERRNRLYVSYYKKPGSSTWKKADATGITGSSDAWVDTECMARGYGRAWGLDHARN